VTAEDDGGAGGHVGGVRWWRYLASRWFRASGDGSSEESRLGFPGAAARRFDEVSGCRSFDERRW
jgi:hypothetical protein